MDNTLQDIYSFLKQGAQVSTDTRNIKKGSVFFALKGDNFDANEFVFQALEKGAILAVSDNQKLEGNDKVVIVDNVLTTLQNLASYHRSLFKIPVIGITGSNGKTTTKELINAVLSKKYNTLCTAGNLNNHIGVPLTLLQLHAGHEIAVIEMGANHMGEIDFLSSLARPDFGLITNIGKAHIEGFGSFENIITGKTELYRFIQHTGGTIFVNPSNEFLIRHCDPRECVTYGDSQQSRYFGRIISSFPFLSIAYQERTSDRHMQEELIYTRLLGAYNFENIMAAVAVGKYFGISPADIKTAIEEYSPKNNRSQLMKTSKNTIVMDAYNANPTSMKAALENFVLMEGESKALILGDMLELGDVSTAEHRGIIDFVKKNKFEWVVFVGKIFCELSENKTGAHYFPDTAEAEKWMSTQNFQNLTVLLKGSRGIKLENLLEYF